MHTTARTACLAAAILLLLHAPRLRGEVPVDTTQFSTDSGIRLQHDGARLHLSWPLTPPDQPPEFARLELNLATNQPLIERLGVTRYLQGDYEPLVSQADPCYVVTVGTRRMPPGKPDNQTWQVFFDNPHQRPHQAHLGSLDKKHVRVASHHRRATVNIEEFTIGPFRGRLQFTLYAGCRIFKMEAIVSTEQDGLAMFYDAGLLTDQPTWSKWLWMDTEEQWQESTVDSAARETRQAVRHRMLVASSPAGSAAIFPPPHQFFFPRDYSDNLRHVWHGRGYLGLTDRYGFGIRQHKDGGGNFVPWFNAPPDQEHHLSAFLLLSAGTAKDAFQETLLLTNSDRFPELPGYLTMTSHWHMAIAVAAMQRPGEQRRNPARPDWVQVFKDMNVNMVHLGEFHGDGHPKDPGPLRLPEMQAMFAECQRWSDERLLVVPGEEINEFLGLNLEGKHPGHWMSLFPRPVYWTMKRSDEQPFVEDHPDYGRVYHVGGRADMIRLIKEENALVWAAHPRIKASSWTPDVFRHEDFYIAPSWLGGAWKAMPADLSRDKLGERVLDLLDDMANWGQKKYVLGEVDVFKIDHTHELYGHMNVNYVRMDQLPRFEDGWQPLLDALRDGQFFVTTGEILVSDFQVESTTSGGNVQLPADGRPTMEVQLHWTFPLAYAEIVSGDGRTVYRERLDLSDTQAFGNRRLMLLPDLAGRRWVRFEVWDVAANGAFTQPVWILP